MWHKVAVFEWRLKGASVPLASLKLGGTGGSYCIFFKNTVGCVPGGSLISACLGA